MAVLVATDFVLPGLAQDGGLDISATRYCPQQPQTVVPERSDGLALLCIHGVSFRTCLPISAPKSNLSSSMTSIDKESLLPMLEYLFELQIATQDRFCHIHEAWVLDSPNHGRAAVLNAKRLLDRPQGISTLSFVCI